MTTLEVARRDGFIPANSEEARGLIADFGDFGRRMLVVMMEAAIDGGNGTYDVWDFIKAAADPQTPEQWRRCWETATEFIERLYRLEFDGAIRPGKCGDARPSDLQWFELSPEEQQKWARRCRRCRVPCGQPHWKLLPILEKAHLMETGSLAPVGAVIGVTLLRPTWLDDEWPTSAPQ